MNLLEQRAKNASTKDEKLCVKLQALQLQIALVSLVDELILILNQTQKRGNMCVYVGRGKGGNMCVYVGMERCLCMYCLC